jgi:hypothetical protein
MTASFLIKFTQINDEMCQVIHYARKIIETVGTKVNVFEKLFVFKVEFIIKSYFQNLEDLLLLNLI